MPGKRDGIAEGVVVFSFTPPRTDQRSAPLLVQVKKEFYLCHRKQQETAKPIYGYSVVIEMISLNTRLSLPIHDNSP
jgi:hypothetical protein